MSSSKLLAAQEGSAPCQGEVQQFIHFKSSQTETSEN
jgi:hypothetical protein